MKSPALSLQTRHQLIPKILNALLKSIAVPSLPVRLATRHSILPSEAQEQHIVLAMAIIAIDITIGETHLRERNGRFTSRVLAIGIAPDAIDLYQRRSDQ